MKTLLALLPLFAALTTSAFAGNIKGTEEVMIPSSLIDGHAAIPATGDLRGSVVSVYAGSAHALERYVVTVNNTAAPCEGDDCLAAKTFELSGGYTGVAQAVYSRKIDKNTYSIAIITNVLDSEGWDDNGGPARVKSKILLRVKFNKDGVSEIADESVEAIG